jgi:hypothetical protein
LCASGVRVKTDDVVFYRQLYADCVDKEHGLFNHAAFVVALGSLTDRYRKKEYSSHMVPLIAEHSGGYEMSRRRLSQENNVYSINDTWVEVQEIIIIHVLDYVVDFGNECPWKL